MRSVLVVLAACGPGLAKSKQEITKKPTVELTSAADIEALLQGGVTNGGLYFEDAECARDFASSGDLMPESFPAFAKCLAGLGLQRSTREDSLGDVSVYSYAPGFELQVRIVREVSGPRITWIGFASRRTAAEPPTITKAAFEALRTGGDPNGPLEPAESQKMVLDPIPSSGAEYAWLRVCLDETGKVTGVTSFEATSGNASKAFAAAAAKWTFKPFLLQGQPVPACAMVRPAYPAERAPSIEALPLPLPPPRKERKDPLVISPGSKTIEGHRIRGKKYIVPDDETKTLIAQKGYERLIGTFRLCMDDKGVVDMVLPVKSTGLAGYDRRIMAEMQQWAYAPYTVDGQPVPVCTAVTFVYTQR